DEDFRVCRAPAALGEQPEQRLACDLGGRVPHRHVERADRDRTLAVPARLLVGHHRGPDLVRIEIVATLVDKTLGLRFENAIAEAFADKPALPVAAVRVEAVTNHAASV